MRGGWFSLSERVRGRVRHHARLVARGGACLFVVHALAGCFLDIEKPDPRLDVPDSFVTARKGPDSALPPLDWWRGFRSHELTLLMEEAQTANLDIAAAVARIEQADAAVRTANAALLPILDFNSSATRSLTSTAGGGGGTGGGSAHTLYNVNLQASYTLDFWGKNRAALLAADENAISSRYAKDVVALTTLVSVANAYFNVLSAQDRLSIARDNLEAARRILTAIDDRFKAGTASELDTSQQESLVAQVRATIPPLEILLRQNKMALALLVGRAPEHFILRGGGTRRIAIPRVAPGLPSDLISQRPDIREAEANLRSANFSVEVARDAFFPTICNNFPSEATIFTHSGVVSIMARRRSSLCLRAFSVCFRSVMSITTPNIRES